MMRYSVIFTFVLILALSLASMEIQAATLTFNLDFEFSGATPPQGVSPWITAIFDDSVGGSDTVGLTMQANNLVGTEFVNYWLCTCPPKM